MSNPDFLRQIYRYTLPVSYKPKPKKKRPEDCAHAMTPVDWAFMPEPLHDFHLLCVQCGAEVRCRPTSSTWEAVPEEEKRLC